MKTLITQRPLCGGKATGHSKTTNGQISINFSRHFQNAFSRSRVQRSRSQTTHGRNVNDGPHDTRDIVKVTGSKVKVIDNVFKKCTFPEHAYRPSKKTI